MSKPEEKIVGRVAADADQDDCRTAQDVQTQREIRLIDMPQQPPDIIRHYFEEERELRSIQGEYLRAANLGRGIEKRNVHHSKQDCQDYRGYLGLCAEQIVSRDDVRSADQNGQNDDRYQSDQPNGHQFSHGHIS